MRHIIPLAALLALTACGTRGNLVLPPGPPPPPLFGNPAPAPAKPTKSAAQPERPATDAQGGGDLNTPTESPR